MLDARFGRGVAAIGEAVDHEVTHRETSGELQQRLQVAEAGVHAAVGDQPDQVHTLRAGERVHDRGVLAQHPVEHGVVDTREVLADDSAGAEVEVADLGVAHLALGEPHGAPGGRQRGVRVGAPQRVEHRRARQRDGVAGARVGEAPAVQHDQAGAGQGERRQEAACTIDANVSACSEAPPTSAPSTSGSASSEGALSGLTEPP